MDRTSLPEPAGAAPAQRAHPIGQMSTHRVEALADGVFAIVMTLLVFDLRLPDAALAELPAELAALWPKFLGYGVSFLLLGIYWVGHRNQFNFVRRADQNFHWLNIFFFGVVCLVPFSTGILSRYPDALLAVAIYGINLIMIGVALFFIWTYATYRGHLVDADVPRAVVRLGKQRSLLAPACYLVAILAGLIDPHISLVIYALVPLLYIFPGLQHFWTHLAHR
ncbi:MAG TPA: TMEM175 family protein [Anaerolineae bacterium]|nr:TMEM175 family protein [Anaerolineae bacterium]